MPEAVSRVSSASAVSRVIDYEPSTVGGPPILAPVTTPRRQSPGLLPIGSHGVPPDNRAASMFADAALRRVLEVLDRRRPLAQLRPLLAPGLIDSLMVGPARHAHGGGAARLRRVLAQPCRPDGSAAEVAANYLRADRVHAIACRIERLASPTGPRWQVVALHIG